MYINFEHPIDRYFRRNTLSISAVEFCWGLALPVLFESTFLQIFLRQIGASNIIVGLIPAILSTGIMLFSLMSAYLTSHLARKKLWVIMTHIAASIPLIVFGMTLSFISADHRVGFFLVCYSCFALLIGLSLPMWQNFTVMIFSPHKALKGLSVMYTTQITTKLIGGLLLFKSVEQYSFSIESASFIFVCAGATCFIGSLGFFTVKESVETCCAQSKERHNIRTMIASGKKILNNRNYMLYLAGTIEIYATVAVISFYANYAVEWKGINKEAAAGLFVSCIYIAGIIINILVGWIGLFSLKSKFVLARGAAICGTLMLLFSSSLVHFLSVSFILGISRGINQAAHSHAVKTLSGEHDATDYFALSTLFIFPFSAGIPLISGVMLDKCGSSGASSYIILFSGLMFVQSASLILTLITDFKIKK